MSDQRCPTCGGTSGFVNRRGTLDVCDDPWHGERDSQVLREDAERYRYLRDLAGNEIMTRLMATSDIDAWDAIVDAERALRNNQESVR